MAEYSQLIFPTGLSVHFYVVLLVNFLEGPETVCAFPDGDAAVLRVGNPGMAKGGSGDVLAGMFAALLCQMPARDAVQTAVWLHGRAGDLCAERMGEYAMNPTDRK